jgi:hypothetical protein
LIRPELLVVHGTPRPGLSKATHKAVQSFIWSDAVQASVVALNPGTAVAPTPITVAARFWDDLFRHGGTDDSVRELRLLDCGVDDQDWLVWNGVVQAAADRAIALLEEDPE